MKRLSGVKVPHLKHTEKDSPIRMNVPSQVTIPMVMHIGAPCKPVVAKGDTVFVGQVIGEPQGVVSAAIHATVSGTVSSVENVRLSAGVFPAVVIQSDGKQSPWEGIEAPKIEDRESFFEAVRDCGLVGLGGAGFPTSVKLSIKEPAKAEYLVVNGAECEPYLTSDLSTMLDDTDDIISAIKYVCKYVGIEKVILGIEDNKPEAVSVFKNRASEIGYNFSVKVLPSQYPQGAEKVLIYNCTGRAVPAGKLPVDVGCIVMNVTTLAVLGKYIRTGMPLIEKCVTVDGPAVKKPGKVIAPIGTAVRDVIEALGGYKTAPAKIIYGGPMMGTALPSDSEPIIKNTNGIIVYNAKDAFIPEETECINCGRCVYSCPFSLMPNRIARAYKLKDADELKELNVNTCMECGCCAYVCPAKKDLVQTMKLSKALLAKS